MDAEPLDVVKRVVQRVDFQFAAVAGPGVDLPDRETMAEAALRRFVQAGGERGDFRIGWRTWLGQRPAQAFAQESQHLVRSSGGAGAAMTGGAAAVSLVIRAGITNHAPSRN